MNYMRTFFKIVLCAMILLQVVACKKDLYDKEQYQKYLKYMSPVDSVDQRHDWKLTTPKQYSFIADAGSNIQKVMVLDVNPFNSKQANVLNQATITDGGSSKFAVSVPLSATTLYAALVDADGRFYVKSFPVSQEKDISFLGASAAIPTQLTLTPQTYTYCFEKDLPLVDDYDYNDLIIRLGIEKDLENPCQVTLQLTLSAVGCTNQIAAFVRLCAFNKDNVEDITTIDGKTLNDNLPAGSKNLTDKINTFQWGRNSDAVICLFADAHWAMNNNQETSANAGAITRKNYNVLSDISYDQLDLYETTVYRKQSYVITFTNADVAKNFTLEDIDPFIVTLYNGARFETHLDYYKNSEVLYEYQLEQDIKDLPWALAIPSESFQYPLEGQQMGFRKRTSTGVAFNDGAYTDFGEWVENYKAFLDWYKRPNEQKVWGF
jgi:LruC domain-containing protein